jgi:hypothetical protein
MFNKKNPQKTKYDILFLVPSYNHGNITEPIFTKV